MSRATATRYGNKANEGKIYYEFSSQGEEGRKSFVIQENTNLVDGIGGVTWVSDTLPLYHLVTHITICIFHF